MFLKIFTFLFLAFPLNTLAGNNTETELRGVIFRQYNYKNRPVLTFNDSVTSTFGVEVISLEEFDQVGEKVKFNFHMKFSWYDEFLRWDREVYDFDYLNIPPDLLWRPDLELYNSANKPEKINGEGILKVYHTGQVYWIIPIMYDYSCPLQLERFPFDTQKCIMTFGSWKLSQRYLNISTHPLFIPPGLEASTTQKTVNLFPPVKFDKFKHNEWEIREMLHINNNVEYLCCPGELWTITEIDIIMDRNYHKYMIVIVMTFFLTLSSLIVSIFTIEKYIRTYLLVFIPLSIIWLQLYISSKMPVIEYPTTMEKFIQLSFYICMISAIYSGIVYNLANCIINTQTSDYGLKFNYGWQKGKNYVRKSYDQGSKFYLDSKRFKNYLFTTDNIVRGLLVIIYITYTFVIIHHG